MKSKILLLLLAASLGFSNYEFENPCDVMMPRGGDEDWGIGAYLIPEAFEIDVFSDNSGNKFGYFETTSSYLNLKNNQSKIINIDAHDMEWIGHYSYEMIKVKQCSNPEFVKVLWNTTEDDLFISEKELKKEGAQFYSYKDLLFNENISIKKDEFYESVNIGVNLEKGCLNLRAAPTTNAKKLKCIHGNNWNKSFHTHFKILETKNNWAKVESVDYHFEPLMNDSGENCSFLEKNKTIGWIKAIDESGFPNIWFSTTSY